MLKLGISGCLGRMGQRIIYFGLKDPALSIAVLLEQPQRIEKQKALEGLTIQSSPEALKGCDVLIEFTTPEATLNHLAFCQQHQVKMVIGTTGLFAEQVKQIEGAAQTIPIVYSSNMSVGVNIFFKLARELSAKASGDYQVKIAEAHHIHKKDAPSGTAKALQKIIESASDHRVPDIQSVREGEIVGDHKIIFESAEDVITLDHHAKSRDIFAKGALVAAKFLDDKKHGLFDMQDVLNLR